MARKKNKAAQLGHEAELRQMVDALRGSIWPTRL